MEIVAAILEKTTDAFEEVCIRLKNLDKLKRIQVDFGDGIFVPNKILSIENIPKLDSNFFWEAHLMLQSPTDFKPYKEKGFGKIIIHLESYEKKQDVESALVQIKNLGLISAICINPKTELGEVLDLLQFTKEIQLMSVFPGFQGQKFIPEIYEKISTLHKTRPDVIIEIDGGVSPDNISKLKNLGVSYAVCGSSLVKAADIFLAYKNLQNQIEKS